MSWKYESDGGDYWDGSVHRRRMRTHYLVRCEALERVDCRSKREALKLLDRHEAGKWNTPKEAELVLREMRGLEPLEEEVA